MKLQFTIHIFLEQPFYGHFLTLDSHHMVAYLSRWLPKPRQGLLRMHARSHEAKHRSTKAARAANSLVSIINTKKNEEIENIEVSYKEQGKSSRLRLIKRMSSSWVAHFVISKP